jgi:SAM-dependent methyltransferase
MDRVQIPPADIARHREARRQPRRTQFDYLHLQRLREDLSDVLGQISGPVSDVLDVFCGARPYEDLMPPGARVVGYDVDDHYGAADVVGGEFLPFEDESFDLVTCISGFYYVEDQVRGAAEIRRVLRPGGTVVITVPQVWEYRRDVFEHRYTESSLRAIFTGWDDIRVIENGGRAVAWTLMTGMLLSAAVVASPAALTHLTRMVVTAIVIAVNLVGDLLDRVEQRKLAGAPGRMPANLTLVARSPVAQPG